MQTFCASKCGITTSKLSPAILEVIGSLSRAGYTAYIVGGSVRDLLLGKNPKDFDAVTNATPAQIKRVFGRRCRIIGRRFELAHVHSGREIIEVATFRAPPTQVVTNATGMVLRDNHWGTIEQDFSRRDFSVNTLYYQPYKNIILDFCHALQDFKQQRLRLLGEPKQRFEEDPVRMLRALRFSAKLDFKLDKSITDILTDDCAALLQDVSPHRLYDESQKMFAMGSLSALLPLLIQYGLWQQLFPAIPAEITPFIQRAAENTDERIAQDKSINSAFFYAVLLWQPYLERLEFYRSQGMIYGEARVQASIDVIKRQSARTAMPRFAEMFIRETWEMQTRLVRPKPSQIVSLANHPRFRAGFDFLVLREQIGDETTNQMVQWWETYQNVSNDHKEKLISQYRRDQQKERQQNTHLGQEELEPLVLETKVNNRASRRAKQKAKANVQKTQSSINNGLNLVSVAPPTNEIEPKVNHPILRRRRVERDLAMVVFGPTK